MKTQFLDSLVDFSANREKLQGIYSDADGLLKSLKMEAERKVLSEARANLDADTFKVLVIGEFKRGKSTFINALLGEEVLPSFSIPCTAVINEIKYSETKRAVLHFQSPLPDKRPRLADDVERHIAAHRGDAAIPPMEIPVERIEEFVVIPDPGKDQAESVAESPFAKVDIYWPIDLCKNNVEIIDSPGLNEHGTRTKVTTDYLSKVDAVIFVLSCSALASESELNVIDDSIIGGGHEDIFFVCNRFDEIRDRERPRLVQFGHQRLAQRTKLGEDGIVFLSSRDALDAKEAHDGEALTASGFPPLESKLVRFLVENRGRMKLLRPANSLRRQLRKATGEVIPLRRTMLAKETGELERKVAEAKPKLVDAEKRRDIVLQKMETEIIRIGADAKTMVARFAKDCADEVPGWLESYTPQAKVKFFTLESRKSQFEKLAAELIGHVQHKISERQREWGKKEFLPELERKMEFLREKTSVDMDEFFSLIGQVKAGVGAESATDGQRQVGGWERAAAAGIGWFVLGAGSAVMGANEGFKGLLKSAMPQIGLAVLLIGVLGVMNPFILIPALFASGTIQALLGNDKEQKKLCGEVAKKLREGIRDNADKAGADTAAKIEEKMREFKANVGKSLEAEIATVRESLDEVVELKRKGDASAQKELELLDECAHMANSIADAIDELEEGVKC